MHRQRSSQMCQGFLVRASFCFAARTTLTVRWHDRSDTCIEESWEISAPTGTFPDEWTDCPKEWFWHKVCPIIDVESHRD